MCTQINNSKLSYFTNDLQLTINRIDRFSFPNALHSILANFTIFSGFDTLLRTCYLLAINLIIFVIYISVCALAASTLCIDALNCFVTFLTHFLLRNSIESDTLWISECFAHCTVAFRRESIAASVVAAAPIADHDHFSVSLCDIDLMVVD